jgi:hypothetical protein
MKNTRTLLLAAAAACFALGAQAESPLEGGTSGAMAWSAGPVNTQAMGAAPSIDRAAWDMQRADAARHPAWGTPQ